MIDEDLFYLSPNLKNIEFYVIIFSFFLLITFVSLNH